MILTGSEIEKQVDKGRIHIVPYDAENICPNSYDVRLSYKLRVLTDKILDPTKESGYREIFIPKSGYILKPGVLYLGSTIEEIGSDYYVPMMQARSSIGRLGMSIFLNSGMGDLGYKQQWTLMIQVIHPLKIYREMNVGQIYFMKPEGQITLYDGRYKNSVGPTPSRIWQDFN